MFKENSKAIYLQIADRICNDIMAGAYREGDRLPSVRDFAATVQVNPNTLMRTYEYLSAKQVIFNRRGIGFFVADDAVARVRRQTADNFMTNDLPEVFARLALLDIAPADLAGMYQQYLDNHSSHHQQ